jgi:phage I-like protein
MTQESHETHGQMTRRLMREHGWSYAQAYERAWRTLADNAAQSFCSGEGVALAEKAAEGEAPVWIQLAKYGTFLGHPSGPFKLDRNTFEEIVANFRATENRHIPIDYEHASEASETSGTIPVNGAPAQGWIIDMKIDGQGLWGLVEWLPQAREQIRAKQYRYFSPAIRFGTKDRVTGKPTGARMSSGAITNSPFLDGLEPLAAKDEDLSHSALTRKLMKDRGLGYLEAYDEATHQLRAKAGRE